MTQLLPPNQEYVLKSGSCILQWHNSLREILEADWGSLNASDPSPFFEWDWLNLLETSGSVTPSTGWMPIHPALRSQSGELLAACPLYLKNHSFGEFIHDHSMAYIAEKLGFQYYPKVLGMSPFTPGSQYSIMSKDGLDRSEIIQVFGQSVIDLCQRSKFPGAHFLHCKEELAETLTHLGYILWLHESYIWRNQGYENFKDFLEVLPAKRKRTIRQERRKFEERQCQFTFKTGSQITEVDMLRMYGLYEATCAKFGFWGSKYLTKKFFQEASQKLSHRLLLVVATPDGNHSEEPLGMSFFVVKDKSMFGRYWGANVEMPGLHFELCYYQPIQWAILNGIAVFDAGAGNRDRKMRRGFQAETNRSLHYFTDPRLAPVMKSYISSMNEALSNIA